MRLKKRVICFFFSVILLGVSHRVSAQIILQQDFTNYQGTAATVPTGWYISNNACYTSTLNSSNSGPNSYKFSVNGATVVTPQFSDADSVYFWIRGNSTDSASNLEISESSDSLSWTSIKQIYNIGSGTTWGLSVDSTAKYLRFVYTKSSGNIAFDDFKLIKTQHQSPNPPQNDSSTSTAVRDGKIKIYFDQPVDTTVSIGVNAIYLQNSMEDTLVAYINRAKYSIDIAQYDYLASSTTNSIATAINNAYSRGVNVRWIYDASESNSGMANLSPNIDTLGRVNGSSQYGIMHDKFVVIDAKSPNPDDAIVITGSTDWISYQFQDDYNNMIIFQDSLLADAYTKEFNQMWGSSGLTPNRANAKFGNEKSPVLTNHIFNVDGTEVELYFSPEDATRNHIIDAINTANTDLYFGVYTFTNSDIANAIKSKIENDVYTAGIMDQYSLTYPADTILSPVMGNLLQIYSGSEIYHNKMGIIDPSDTASDPQVITGSYNWTNSAETENDENTVIIHNPIVANIYFQAFHQDFTGLGGTLTNQTAPVDTTCPKIVSNSASCSAKTWTYAATEPLDNSSAMNLSNYAVSPVLAISNITQVSDSAYTLTFAAAFTPNVNYTIHFTGVTDTAGNVICDSLTAMPCTTLPDTTCPKIVSNSANCSTKTWAYTATEPLDNSSAMNLSNYAVNPALAISSITQVSDSEYTLTFAAAFTPNVNYTIHFTGVTDTAGNVICDSLTAMPCTTLPDTTCPKIISNSANCSTKTWAYTATESLDNSSAMNLSNYAVSPALAISSITQVSDSEYTLTFAAAFTPNVNYTIHFTGVTDTAGNVICDSLTAMPCNSTTGIKNISKNELPSIYPNPSNGSFYVKNIGDFTQLKIRDITGRLILQTHLNDNKQQIELKAPNGIYFITFANRENKITHKLVIMR